MDDLMNEWITTLLLWVFQEAYIFEIWDIENQFMVWYDLKSWTFQLFCIKCNGSLFILTNTWERFAPKKWNVLVNILFLLLPPRTQSRNTSHFQAWYQLSKVERPALTSETRPQQTLSISWPWEAAASGCLVVSRGYRVHWVLMVDSTGTEQKTPQTESSVTASMIFRPTTPRYSARGEGAMGHQLSSFFRTTSCLRILAT